MSNLLNTLPGDIPGLLRRGSPVLYTAAIIPGVMLALIDEDLGEFSDPPILSIALFGQHVMEDRCIDIVWRDRTHLQVDLTDPTGRAHAAWWCTERSKTFLWPSESRGEDEAVMLACLGAAMTPTQIDTLARLVFRLAGRTT